jgi:hypothetical protein
VRIRGTIAKTEPILEDERIGRFGILIAGSEFETAGLKADPP